ncbi:hypothetical protein HAX54_028203 [Datura stramonium]|uniref:Uncharacterized protein n=1 Tax=Datura stramonium TaxID=4076 RepID=A0ABS8V6A7_DATST|nr:hypothetical protein [Datura stramonium]
MEKVTARHTTDGAVDNHQPDDGPSLVPQGLVPSTRGRRRWRRTVKRVTACHNNYHLGQDFQALCLSFDNNNRLHGLDRHGDSENNTSDDVVECSEDKGSVEVKIAD